jgi:antitoxin (DNA-binding transcriptional repressor) of toxin-antitoxin stability system
MSKTLTTRDFFRSPRKVARLVQMGRRITVTRAGTAFFDVVPIPKKKGKTIGDFAHLMFSDPKLDRDLSKKVDEIVYGRRR